MKSPAVLHLYLQLINHVIICFSIAEIPCESATMLTMNTRRLCHGFESNSTARISSSTRKRRWTPANHEDCQTHQASADLNFCLEPDRAFECAERFSGSDGARPTQPDADPGVGANATGAFGGHSQFQRGSQELCGRSIARRHFSHAH